MLQFELRQALERAEREGRVQDAQQIRFLLGEMEDAPEPQDQAEEYLVQEGDDPFNISEDLLGSVEFLPDFLAENPNISGMKAGTYVRLPRVGRLAEPEPEKTDAEKLVELFETKGPPGDNWTPEEQALLASFQPSEPPSNKNNGAGGPATSQPDAGKDEDREENEGQVVTVATEGSTPPANAADEEFTEEELAEAQEILDALFGMGMPDPTTWSPGTQSIEERRRKRVRPVLQAANDGQPVGDGAESLQEDDTDYESPEVLKDWNAIWNASMRRQEEQRASDPDELSMLEEVRRRGEAFIEMLSTLESGAPTQILRENLVELMTDDEMRVSLHNSLDNLTEQAEMLAIDVSNATTRDEPLMPVEGFSQLLDGAWEMADGDVNQFMWLATNVVLGIDAYESPNVFLGGLAGVNLPNTDQKPFEEYSAAANPNFVSPLLPFNQTPSENLSDLGDWRPELFDGTANQAFHFWNSTAITFYNSELIAKVGDWVHDPVYLDPETLNSLQEKFELVRQLTGSQVTQEDANLSQVGIAFGDLLREFALYRQEVPEDWTPRVWIMENLSGRD